MARLMVKNGGLAVRHLEMKQDSWQYLRGDRVHLNAVGIDMWCLGLQDGVQKALWD